MPLAVVCRELGEPEGLRLEAFESKPLTRGQARIAVRAVGLNYTDVLTVAGTYQHKPPLPFVPGTEAAGDVVEIADDVISVRVGDRVIVKQRLGAYADETVAAAENLVPVPSTFDYAQGATFFAGFGTAYCALVERAAIVPGETLLVHGAAGGMGLAAVQLGKIYGAKVIAVASSDEKLAVARACGADHTLLSGEPFRERVKALTEGRGADVVFDPVGGAVLEESLRCMNFNARICVIGFLAGVGLARTNLLLIKNASLLGIRAGESTRRDPTIGPKRQAELLRLAEEGRIAPHISYRLPLQGFAEAMRLLIDRKAIGRVALVVD